MEQNTRLGGRYRLERRLAAGGMGQVWLARDTSLHREVAVKLLPVDTESDPAAVERFRREARTMAGLQHPNIVAILDAGTHEGSAFIVMELLTGPTLAQLLAERGPLPEREVIPLAAQITAGLGAAHRAGVIHRDLKPSNLMFGASGGLKIVDFGIARLAQATTARLTATNAIIGSPPYLSPEQATGAPTDERSDLYSLGCIITMMITGSPPFSGEHPVAVLHQHVHEAPPVLRERQPAVSPELESLVQELLEKSPSLRPRSAEVVERRLAAIADGTRAALDTTVLATTRAVPAAAAVAGVRSEAAPAPTLVQPSAALARPPRTAGVPLRQRRAGRIAAGAALAAAAALTGVLLAPLLGAGDQTAGTPAPRASATPSAPRSSSTPRSTPTPSQLGSTASPSPRTTPAPHRQKPGKTHHPRKPHDPPKHKRGGN